MIRAHAEPRVFGRLDLPGDAVKLTSGYLAVTGEVQVGGPVERVELWVEGVGQVPTRLEGDGSDGGPATFETAFVLPRGLNHLRVDLFVHLTGGGQSRIELPTRGVSHLDDLVTAQVPLAAGETLWGALDEPAPRGQITAGETSIVRGWVGAEGRRVARAWIEVAGARTYLERERARTDVGFLLPTIEGADRTGFVGDFVAPERGPHVDIAMWAELDDGARVRWLSRRVRVVHDAVAQASAAETPRGWPQALFGWARSRLSTAALAPERREPEPAPASDPEGYRGRDEALGRLEHANHLSPGLRRRLHAMAVQLRKQGGPRLGLLLPLSDISVKRTRECLRSLVEQLYESWELWVIDDGTSGPYLAGALASDPRVHRIEADVRGVAALQRMLRSATTEHIAVLDPDLLLPADALFAVARALSESPELDVLYGDEDRVDARGRRFDPRFKPPYNPALALGADYFGRLAVFRRSLALDVGGYDERLEGAHEHDLLLRMIERRGRARVRHLPRVLVHRRESDRPGAPPEDALGRCVTAALARRGYDARAVPMAQHEDGRRIVWSDDVLRTSPVTIVIPTRDRLDLLRTCVDALKRTVPGPALRVILVDDHSERPETLAYFQELSGDDRFRVVRPPGPRAGFNFARLVNFGVEHVETPLVLLLNNDCEALRPGWLAQMVGWTNLPDVGVVGARLLYADGRIQHAGVTIGVHGGLADHLLHGAPGDSDGYLGLSRLTRDASAVTGACLLTPVALYRELGGLDEVFLGVDYNDIDFCLRALGEGRRVIYAAEAELRHLGSASRGIVVNPLEKAAFVRLHEGFTDPFVNPAFHTESPRFVIEPHRALHTFAAPERLQVLVVPGADNADASSELHDLVDGLLRRPELAVRVLRRASPPLGGDPSVWRRGVGRIAGAIETPDVVLAFGAGAAHGVELARQLGRASVYHLLGREPFEVTAGLYGVGPAAQEVLAQAISSATRVVFSSVHVVESYQPLDSHDRYRVLPVGVSVPRLEAFRRTHPRATLRSRHGFGERELLILLVSDGEAGPAKRAIREAAPNACVYQLSEPLARPLTPNRPVLAREELLGVADIVVMTHGTPEVFPRVLVEAMAFHLPVIGPWVPGVGDVIGPDVHGYMTDMRSSSKVSAILARLVEDPALRQRVGDHAAVQVRLLLDASRRAGQHAELLREAYVATL